MHKNTLNISFANKDSSLNHQSAPGQSTSGIIIFINSQLNLDKELLLLDQQHHGIISKTIQNKLLFTGKFGQIKMVNSVNKDGEIKYLFIVGTGEEDKLTLACIEKLGGKVCSSANSAKISAIFLKVTGKIGDHSSDVFAAQIASGVLLASYKFDKYFTKLTESEKFALQSFEIVTDNEVAAEKLFAENKSIAEAVFFARDVINEPSNVKTPEAYAERILKELTQYDVDVTIFGEREMKNFGMGALLGVGQGSQNESKLVVMQYNGLDKNTAPVAFVGKGVTFDTGGISLKPSSNMADMRYDMAGSAAVAGAILALAKRKARVNVVGVVGLVENMPSGNAQRPGDVVVTMSGQTAEVLDTDAEGRLVLADAIWYAQEKFQPSCVIDLATLTGAIVVALGSTYAGCFANDDQLADRLIHAGNKVNEKLWRMPLHEDFDAMIKSDIADMANLGNVRGSAGSSTAAHFVGRFIQEKMIWAHLDIAGVANSKKSFELGPKGAVGWGVKLLNQFVQDYYEK